MNQLNINCFYLATLFIRSYHHLRRFDLAVALEFHYSSQLLWRRSFLMMGTVIRLATAYGVDHVV